MPINQKKLIVPLTPLPRCKSAVLSIKNSSPLNISPGSSQFVINNGDSSTINTSNVLASLKSSSKGSLKYRTETCQEDDPHELCDLKNPGDLSHLNISPGCSFREPQSDGEEYFSKHEDETDSDDSFEILTNERYNDDDEEEDNAPNLSIELLISELALDRRRKHEVKVNTLERCTQYQKRVKEIRKSIEEQSKLHWVQDQKSHLNQLERIQECFLPSPEKISELEKRYVEDSEKHWENLREEIEKIKAKEAEEAASHTLALSEFQQLLELFVASHQDLKTKFGSSNEEILNQKMLENFDLTITKAKQAFEMAHAEAYSILQIEALKQQLLSGLTVLNAIKDGLDSKQKSRDNSFNQTDTSQVISTTTPPSVNIPAPEAHSPKPNEPPKVSSSPQPSIIAQQEPIASSLVSIYQSKYEELKRKALQVSELAAEMKQDSTIRPLLSRGISVVNQLNNVAHDSSNRSKLQHIFNMLAGRTFTVGDQQCVIPSNSSGAAFIKDYLSTTIIALAHDRQISSMAIYASLMLRIWQSYPEVGELILYRLYESCPFLVPINLKRSPSHTDEEYHRSLGMRHKEGGEREAIDKYLTRMGALAQLYGRIVAMDVSNKHPHGLEEGWKWLARVVSMPPFPSVTATLLNGFLSTAGYALLNNYGSQFAKLVKFISFNFVPILTKETLEGGTTDLASLNRLLEDFLKTNRIPPPNPNNKLIL